jgi:hypothetical protein
MDQAYRHLRADKLIETAERLAARIKERFPGAGLAGVAAAVGDITREAMQTAERIQRPNWALRGSLLGLLVLVLGGAVAAAIQLQGTPLERIMQFMKDTWGALIYVSAAVVFLVTLETRFKRARAVKAIQDLRALAHIIDMHQLAKDPDRAGLPPETDAKEPGLNAEAMGHYLHYCTELLALVSKVGQLYVQDFPDGTALAAVDQFENLATGLSQKIWQKIMILDDIRGEPAREVKPS